MGAAAGICLQKNFQAHEWFMYLEVYFCLDGETPHGVLPVVFLYLNVSLSSLISTFTLLPA